MVNVNPPKSVPDFGSSFSYELWTPGTEIVLLNVPWFNDYRDIVQFPTQHDFDKWINQQSASSVVVSNLALIKPNNPVRLDIPFIDANGYNYMAVRSPQTPTGSRAFTFYYFINSVNYVAPNTTEFIVQLDVWQSFGHKVKFGRCYVERGHIGIADSRSGDNNGLDVLTVPEPFDLGAEYGVVGEYRTDNGPNSSVMVISTTDLLEDPGTIDNPKLMTASGVGGVNDIPNGADVYFFKRALDFSLWLKNMRDKPWVTRGIIAAYMIPQLTMPNGQFAYTRDGREPDKIDGSGVNGKPIRYNLFFSAPQLKDIVPPDWRQRILSRLPTPYRKLRKFLTSPYLWVELTTYSGSPLMIRPELLSGDGIPVYQFNSLAMPNPRIMWWVSRYNVASIETEWASSNSGEYLDVQVGLYNFPQVPVVNDGYTTYMASTAHSRAYAYDSADWAQQRAIVGNQLSYDQSSASIDLNTQLTSLGNSNRMQQANLQNTMAMARGIESLAMGGITGGVGGAVMGGLTGGASAAMSVYSNNQSTSLANQYASGVTSAVNSNSAYVRDTNKTYADWAAKGDYSNTIAGINAKVQDAKLTQPSTAGQFGGEASMVALGDDPWDLKIKIKFINRQALIAIGDYWLRYGYAVNRFVTNMPDDLGVMTNFTYWKLRETYFETADCPEVYRQTIRGIFEKGVTVWRNPGDIGRLYIGDNDPIVKEYF